LATMQRTKKALTWLEGIIGASDVCGLTMTDIVRQYENDQLHKSSTEMKIYGSIQSTTKKEFGFDDIGRAIKYAIESKIIYEVGVSVARFVSTKFIAHWYHDLPELSIRDEKCSFCRDGQEAENTTHCQCILINVKKEKYQLRPWHDLNGQISTHVFGVFLTPIVDAIYHAPGICEEELVAKFDHMCTRVTLVEFLRILEMENIILGERIKYSESSPVPFCDATKDIIIIAYQAQPNALERITALLGELKV